MTRCPRCDGPLPQITTIEELAALSPAALLVGVGGCEDRRDEWIETLETTGRADLVFPLTLVWQP